ncbi:hypothetical protein K490DRAFT_38157 [Saccharata proteae CBS 121410]|uniref:T6SS Phospholipase effector Tle1-like catalytic domain-containing protein n=1 Tax=Saccharata proteae CBS 121410 TaxID=1314787 RepID=A0A6A5YC61_9PEZI|nr:hypothetical protein K490DRAFT_38157 [Saccharata proteae CBS 121410]
MSHPAPTSPPKKRIIICCDGTWQTSAHGTHSIPSNIAKLSRSLSPWYFDPESSQWAPQVVYYDAGVGTGVSRVEKKYAGAFGLGLDENVCEAYNFLVNNYVEGDDLFFFGFSRGAYTVRATAGLVCRVGICRTDMMDKFWEMWAAYRSCGSGTDLGKTEWGRELREGEASSALPLEYPPGHPVKDEEGKQIVLQTGAGAEWLGKCVRRIKIKVVGVFDTVGSLGYPDTALGILKNQNPSGFHDTGVHPRKSCSTSLAFSSHHLPFFRCRKRIPRLSP